MIKGNSGKILWVNLSTREIREESSNDYKEWLGGRSLGTFLVSQIPELKSEEPENQPIAISPGLLVGSVIPLATRTAVSARNNISGGFSYSNVGGGFGGCMKMAGYDSVIVQGKSQKPVIILLEGGTAQIVDASELWGMQISELQHRLKEHYQAKNLSFIGIGPAGEKKVAVSCLMVDQAHAAGWGGSGAIFGAKKLKAIVAIGNYPVQVAFPGRLKSKIRQLEWRINASEAMAGLIRGGTHGMAAAGGYSGLVPTAVNNINDEFLSPDQSAPIREDAIKKWETSRSGCPGCQIRCLHTYSLKTEQFGSIDIEGMHANSVRGFGSNLGVNDPESILIMHKVTNELGLDVDGVSSSLAFALECAEHGILEKQQTGNIKLEWGDGRSLIKLIEQIGNREGLGELLGLGVYRASSVIGQGSEQFAMTTKKVGLNEQGLRSHRAWTLGIMTSTRGGGHLGGAPQTENRKISPELGQRLVGNQFAGDPQSYEGKGKLVAWTEGVKAVVDSLGLCCFAYGWYDLSIGSLEELSELVDLVTGQTISAKQLHQIGFRCHTLERYLSWKLVGYSRKDDQIPDRFYDTSVSSGPNQGAHLDHTQVNKALDEYYETLGWDVKEGIPTKQILKKYNLEDVVKI